MNKIKDTNKINQQITEQLYHQSHSKNLNGAYLENRNTEVIVVIKFIAQTMITLTYYGEKQKNQQNLNLIPHKIK